MKHISYRLIEKNDNRDLAILIRNVFIEFSAHIHKGTIFNDPTTDHLYELFLKPKSDCWIALIDNKIVGCCGVYPTEGLPNNCAELVKFYVNSEARGIGIGKQLFINSIDSARKLGYNKIYLESLPEFTNAVKMYLAFGFEHLAEPLGNSGHFGCNIWMQKDLVQSINI